MKETVLAYGCLNVMWEETMNTVAKEIYKCFIGLSKVKIKNE